MKLRDHPANNDRSAVIVWSERYMDTIHSVYHTDIGFVAATGHDDCLPGLYATKQEAIYALHAGVSK